MHSFFITLHPWVVGGDALAIAFLLIRPATFQSCFKILKKIGYGTHGYNSHSTKSHLQRLVASMVQMASKEIWHLPHIVRVAHALSSCLNFTNLNITDKYSRMFQVVRSHRK